MLDLDTCHAALDARDHRFDGRFFVGVTSTGIYCRPVCPARAPARPNRRFFHSATEAERAGFRACLRCRPETAPGTPAWQGTAATVWRAVRLIDAGALDGRTVPELAARLGLGERQLRKLFRAHLGASPGAVAQTRRLHAARALLGTDLPMGEVASRAGYGSIRRFNEAVRQTFGRSPTELRAGARPGHALRLRLPYRPPLGFRALLDFLRPRAIAGLEDVGDGVWSHRVGTGRIEVRDLPDRSALELAVPASLAAELPALVRRVRRQFDLDCRPDALPSCVPPETRVPGAFHPFATAVRVIVGQQVSVRGATTLASRIHERWGASDPAALRDAPLEEAGLTRMRAHCLRALATAVDDGSLTLGVGTSLDAIAEELSALPGIGPWTAQMLALRVYGEPDAWPGTDLVLRGHDAAAWRPWRAYVAMAIWRGTCSTE